MTWLAVLMTFAGVAVACAAAVSLFGPAVTALVGGVALALVGLLLIDVGR